LNPYPRRLKIEARKNPEQAKETELNIAHSPFSTIQVRLRTLTLNQMWINKVMALSDRREIRDAYDLEFLCRRGVGDFKLLDKRLVEKLVNILNSFSTQDFKVKLGGVLESKERELIINNRFSYLKSKIAPFLLGSERAL
jgi:predicted nucleotidyltransferase component of viral defense system